MAVRTGRETEDGQLIPDESTSLTALAAELQTTAIEQGRSVGTAESCTGGLIGHAITDVPGSSAYYRGGAVSYSDALKVELLGVPPEAIERHGAVSAQVAVAMAHGVRSRLGADVGVAVTGIAGPDGGSPTKPVGLTYVAVAGLEGDEVRRFLWSGDRAGNKRDSAAAALRLLRDHLLADPPATSPR